LQFVVYLDEEGSGWQPRKKTSGEPIILKVDPARRLDDVAAEAIGKAGDRFRDLYYYGGQGPIYWPRALRDASQRPPELMTFPWALPDESGELLWSEGARSRVTIADLQRAKAEGFFKGDPTGVFMVSPMGGEAPPGWHEFMSWLADVGGVVSLATVLLTVVRKAWTHWKDRGAVSPFGFLDVVTVRDQWDERHLARLLRLSSEQTADLLTSLSYVLTNETDGVWVLSDDPDRSGLRRRIIEDYLHRTYDHPQGDDDV
jgi:hypothetical protein